MNDFMHFFTGKLYSKSQFHNWNLPEGLIEQVEFKTHDYFFVCASREQDKGKAHGQTHLHLNIYPINYEMVYILEVKTSKIEPQLLYEVLNLVKNEGFSIITSSGFCPHEDVCHFGIFFNSDKEIVDLDEFLRKINELDKVNGAKVAKFTCKGCEEIKS